MAGIGFVLRRLSRQDNYIGLIRAYYHSLVAAVGPWVLLVVTLSSISYFTTDFVEHTRLSEFVSVINYNLLFSFIFSAPVYMVASRYVSDCIFGRNPAPVIGVLLVGEWYLVLPTLAIAAVFYLVFATMSPLMTIMSIINFVIFTQIWFVMIYLASIRNYRAITISWIIGVVFAITLAIYWGYIYQSTGMLFGLTLGLIFLLCALKANILAEYPYRFTYPKAYRFYFSYNKQLFWAGFFLFSSRWIDKVIMWGAPQATINVNGLRTYPIYDGAMFYSYLSVIPVMALFVFSLETNFYDSYYQYLKNIESNAPYSSLEQERRNIISKLLENGRSFLILQGSLSICIILLAPTIFGWLNLNFLQLGIFRLGTLGAFFSALNFIIVIVFSYFDSQKNMVIITAVSFTSNIIFTFFTLKFGFAYYGYGFACAMLLGFAVGSTLLARFLNRLHYNIFISNVVKRYKFREELAQFTMREQKMD